MSIQMCKDDGVIYPVSIEDILKLPIDTITFDVHVRHIDLEKLFGINRENTCRIHKYLINSMKMSDIYSDWLGVYVKCGYYEDTRKVIITFGSPSSDDYNCWCEVHISQYTIKFIANDDFCDNGKPNCDRVYSSIEVSNKVNDLIRKFIDVIDTKHILGVNIEMFNLCGDIS